MNTLYEGFKQVLKDLPKWEEFQFHFINKGADYKESIKKARDEIKFGLRISKNKQIVSGIYWMQNKENKSFYIGKGKDLTDRILSHYKSHLGEDKSKDWIKFFSSVRGQVNIKWLEIDDDNKYLGETLRIIIERLLTNEIMIRTNNEEPLFEKIHKSIK